MGSPAGHLLWMEPHSSNKKLVDILLPGQEAPPLAHDHGRFATLLTKAQPFPHGFMPKRLIFRLAPSASNSLLLGFVLGIPQLLERGVPSERESGMATVRRERVIPGSPPQASPDGKSPARADLHPT